MVIHLVYRYDYNLELYVGVAWNHTNFADHPLYQVLSYDHYQFLAIAFFQDHSACPVVDPCGTCELSLQATPRSWDRLGRMAESVVVLLMTLAAPLLLEVEDDRISMLW